MKTYSRLRRSTYLASEPPVKRRRILSSSDEDDALQPHRDADPLLRSDAPSTPCTSPPRGSSDPTLPPSTPPSSPPPMPTTDTSTSPLPLPKRRPTFAFFARKKAAARSDGVAKPIPQPLAEQRSTSASANAVPDPAPAVKEKKPQPRRLTQLQLDLGTTPVQKTCKTCGMAYVPSNAEDLALHKRFHAMNVGGVDVGKVFARGGSGAAKGNGEVVWEKGIGGDVIVAVGRRDRAAAKTRVRRVLDVVERELGAVEIPEEELWDKLLSKEEKRRAGPKPLRSRTTNDCSAEKEREETTLRADRFKAYIYVRGSKCIGLCLGERISEAYRVGTPPTDATNSVKTSIVGTNTTPSDDSPQPPTEEELAVAPTTEANTSPITTSSTCLPAHLGISRIWVSSSHRHHGVATALLDAAARDFCGYYFSQDTKRIRKGKVAFSQPTESGARLARRWFGVETGWLVYW
ncbi:ESCO1/2 acetyl-transferase-domain-containing protein [Macrophomina phaseolina]|uniref:ESCO1/2 acetyl-transferase-domain-containing protein n=1 Tax=Macrophomina phaseolina TaxID=35725 RepID=A0ABQ8GGS9_9PEZI|nr:ESCO1/2 acetyl-transferase-domain-containing protein [Macrophomina phaseolina]